MTNPTKASDKTTTDSDEPEIEKCELRLDSCFPETIPIPSKLDQSATDNLFIRGKFADVPITKVTFSHWVTEDGKEVMKEDLRFIKEGTVQRVQFNEIRVPVKIYHDAAPGTRYVTITQGKTKQQNDTYTECKVVNVDLFFSLT